LLFDIQLYVDGNVNIMVFAATDVLDSWDAIKLWIAIFNDKLLFPQLMFPCTIPGLAHDNCYNPLEDNVEFTIKLLLSPCGL